MKKIGSLIRNFYRVLIANSGEKQHYIITQESHATDLDRLLRTTVKNDTSHPQVPPELRRILENRVVSKGRSELLESSFSGLLVPFFSMKHLELKMIVLTIAFMITFGIGPAVNHTVNKNLNPVFYADTLIDSSHILIHPNDSGF